MDATITDPESELTTLIRKHGKWCLMFAAIGAAIGIGAWFGLPKLYETNALMRLDGSPQARLSTQQWVSSLYSRDSSFESFAADDLTAGDMRRAFRSDATEEALFLRLSLRLSDAEKARQVLESITRSLGARDFPREGGARILTALTVETAARPVSPRLPLFASGGAALGGFIGLLASRIRQEKRTSR